MDIFGVKGKAAAAAVQVVSGSLGSVGQAAKDIREAITGQKIVDPEAMAKLELADKQIEASLAEAQAKINEIEAASASTFVSGWRPMIGWICAVSIGLTFVIFPILKLIPGFIVPEINTNELWPLVMSMLGLGTLRTYEKSKGTARS